MRIVKFTASTQKLKKAGLYQLGARKNKLIKVEKYANCTVYFGANQFVIVPEKLVHFLNAEEIQAIKDGKVKLKNGKVA